jgi:hypothetical protein
MYPTSAAFYQALADGSGGFVSVLACVNPPGYGFNGSAAEQCLKGSYNAADTYGNCTACPLGYSTAGPGTGVTQRDCTNNTGTGTTQGCPIGKRYPTAGQHVSPCIMRDVIKRHR